MHRLATAAAAATLLALVGTAGSGDLWAPALMDDAGGLGHTDGGRRFGEDRARAGYGGYADAQTAGQAYYGWRYPFAPPLAAALAATDASERTKPK